MLEKLTLTNFRNHETFRIKTASKNIALVGANGAGKTNILEAISLLNGGLGIRKAATHDIARDGTNDFAVAAELSTGNEISVFWHRDFARRRAKINNEASTLSDLAKFARIVWMTPSEDLLLAASPSDRRIFLDNLITGFDSMHAGRHAKLVKLLSERAYALKNGADDEWLDQIENNISLTASSVADSRVRYSAEINEFFSSGKIALSGMAEKMIIDGQKAGDFEDFYRNYLAENRFLTDGKMVIDGPHHSDFSLLNCDLNRQANKTSSGQQKLLLYKLIAANAKLLNAKDQTTPFLILLDEVNSHLDESARQILFDDLAKTSAQIWMTGIDRASFPSQSETEFIEIR